MEQNAFVTYMTTKTKALALQIINLQKSLPNTRAAKVISYQIIRSATSTAANYRAVCRARSTREFYAKISITIEEADETLFWLELIEESELLKSEVIANQKKETESILKILSKARKTVNLNRNA